MNRSRFLAPIAGVCFLAALTSAPAHSQDLQNLQDIRSMRQSFQIPGTLSWGTQRQNVQRVRVELDENGDARLKFDNQTRAPNWGWREGDWKNWNVNQEIDGVWLRDARGITVDLRNGLGGQTIVGNARITLNPNAELGRPRLSEITISGRVVRYPWDTLDLTGRFSSTPWGGGPNPNPGGGNAGGGFPGGPNGGGNGGPILNNRLDEFSTIKRGEGEFSDNGQTTDISRADIQLNPDGTAQIVLSGDRDYTFAGRWRQVSATRLELRIDTFSAQADRRVFDVPAPGAASLGGGEIRVDGTDLISLRLSGKRGNRDFDAHFEPNTDTNDGPAPRDEDTGDWNDNDNGNDGDWNGGGWNANGGGWNANGGGWNANGGWGNIPGGNGGWNGNWNGGWNNGGGNGGNWNGGWNGNGGHWNGDGDGEDHNTPRPQPIPQTDLHDSWKGWTGEGLGGTKGTLPAPSPQAPTGGPIVTHTSPPFRPHSPDPSTNTAPRNMTPPTQPQTPAAVPVSAPAPAPAQAPAPAPAPDPAPEQAHSAPPAPPQQAKADEKPAPAPAPEPAPAQSDDEGKEKAPRTRVGRPRN